MSRLDFFTIFVVALCILAIIFLIFKATELARGNGLSTPENTTSVADIDDDEYSDEDDLYDGDIGADADSDSNTDTDELGGSVDSDNDEMTGEGENGDDIDYDSDEPEEADTETRTINREPEVISTDASLGKYLVIAGAFKIKSGAQTFARQLRNEGYSNAKSSIFDRGAFAVVLVDRFDSRSEAAALASKLKRGGTEAYVQAVRSSSN